MRILVAEDDRITRVTLLRHLERWGHDVATAEDGQRAWELFNSGKFDVVLTDWEMPRLSGVELIERVRGRPDGADFTYVIMLTSRSDKSDVVRGIEAGADDFIAKPFDREELRVRLFAGERIVHLERTLSDQNAKLRAAGERMRRDLQAASRVQRAMLPQKAIVTPHVTTTWTYVPTDELAGDAIGLHLLDDRYLVCYLADVSGHGVPAALLAVTTMHELTPSPEGASLLRDASTAGPVGTLRAPGRVAFEINRRFTSGAHDGRYLTMVFCVLDTHLGRLYYTTAGHFNPLVLRGPQVVPLPEAGGLPLAVVPDAEYDDAMIQLCPCDRVYLYSDGIIEQFDGTGEEQFGLQCLVSLITSLRDRPIDLIGDEVAQALGKWAGGSSFADDVSLVAVEWLGQR
jgi:phosphoserine phosphatase RsbU/P